MEDGLYISLDPLNDPKSCTYKLKVKEYDEYMCAKSYLGKEWVSLSTVYPPRDDFSNLPVDMVDEFSLIDMYFLAILTATSCDHFYKGCTRNYKDKIGWYCITVQYLGEGRHW